MHKSRKRYGGEASAEHMLTKCDLLSHDVPAMLHDLEQATGFWPMVQDVG